MISGHSPADVIAICESEEIAGLCEDVGRSLIDDGKVQVVFLAGGEGRRLGFDGPKCLYPVCGKPILGRLIEKVPDRVPVFAMANKKNSKEISAFVGDRVTVFEQTETTGYEADLTETEAVFPDGHGGLLSSLYDKVTSVYGISESVFVCQSDNPLSPVCSPLLIGLHHVTRSQMTTAVVAKKYITEKMGSACRINGRNCVVEYGNKIETTNFPLGNIGVYVFDGSFLAKQAQLKPLPYHLRPQSDGSFRREKFIFDLMPIAKRSQFIEMDRDSVFAPVKDKETASAAEILVSKL